MAFLNVITFICTCHSKCDQFHYNISIHSDTQVNRLTDAQTAALESCTVMVTTEIRLTAVTGMTGNGGNICGNTTIMHSLNTSASLNIMLLKGGLSIFMIQLLTSELTTVSFDDKSSSADEIPERDVTYHLIWLLIYLSLIHI